MLDLNLVRVFTAIYETRSVSGAADRLFITQPSASYALARLRSETNDELFKRSRKGMEPTPTATQLYKVFKKSLTGIEKAVAETRVFSPETSRYKFRLALSDLGELLLLPKLIALFRNVAPHIQLEVVPVDVHRLDEWLLTGKIDAALCSRNESVSSAQRELMVYERYVCLLNVDHPRIGETLSLDEYMQERHVVVAATSGHHIVEDRLKEFELEREIALEVPHFAALGELIASSELLVTLPSSAARIYARRGNGRMLELPFHVPNQEVFLYAHTEIGDITAKTWFYNVLRIAGPTMIDP
ncbi:LysR family transcriptional regulator [Erwinia phyllosphaerae]|uniref:LysR family transcriptional regulator n=1 Tax=Erwinia phyllosphaerae TaxID=2853256 RepID=UPI001FEF62F4|nr:LysR family transcriptional regulator [Erwinia phyllosphaerae]MBV4367390.1 LysR family transcriptional regulator [Erwinia phyllosphaerae]